MSNHKNYERPFMLSLLLHQVSYLQMHKLSAALKSYHLTIFQVLSLIHVAKHEEYESVNQRSLEKFTKLSNPGVSKLVDALEQQEYLTRTQDPIDRRNYILRTNPAKKKEIETLRRIVLEVDAEGTKMLTEEERDTLYSLLSKTRSHYK